MQLTTEALTQAAREIVARQLPESFRYYKSFAHFRHPFPGGCSYITINAVTHDRSFYHLAFYLAVRHDAVESLIRTIRGRDTKLDHYSRSIWCYTVNIGPTSPHWYYPIPGWWTFQQDADFEAASADVATFINDLALPYVNKHQDPRAIRQTLLEEPGHAQNMAPYEQVLAIDRLFGEEERADADLTLLDRRTAQWHEQSLKEFRAFRDAFLAGREQPGTSRTERPAT